MGSVSVIFCLTLCVVSVFSFPEKVDFSEMDDFIEGIHGTCTHLWGVTDDQVKNYQFSDKSRQMMCYMKCLLIESKWYNSNEEMNVARVEETIPTKFKDHIMKSINQCKDLEASDIECEKSYNFHACLQKADPENYFLP